MFMWIVCGKKIEKCTEYHSCRRIFSVENDKELLRDSEGHPIKPERSAVDDGWIYDAALYYTSLDVLFGFYPMQAYYSELLRS